MEVNFNDIEVKIAKKEYKYLGRGSGRAVYDLDNGYVVKVAKNVKGIAQNKVEYNVYVNSGADIFAKVVGVSEDFKYLIMEKAEKIKKLTPVLEYFKIKSTRHLHKIEGLQDMSQKYKFSAADLRVPSSWGLIDGVPVIIDYGLTSDVYKEYYLRERLLTALIIASLR